MFAGLLQGIISLHMDFERAGLLAPVVDAIQEVACYGQGRYEDCPAGDHTTFTDLASLQPYSDVACTALECGGFSFEMTVIHVSYFYSVTHLWDQDASPMGFAPQGIYPGRPAAGTLFFFSFVWPHVKLALMHIFFYLPLHPRRRRNANYWLSLFGKWTLADALVMTVVIGLFDLDVDMSFIKLWRELASNGDAAKLCGLACSRLLNVSANSTECVRGCREIDGLIGEIVFSESSLPSSDISLGLRIVGLAAMYCFCAAVVVSLSTGVAIEVLEERRMNAQTTDADADALLAHAWPSAGMPSSSHVQRSRAPLTLLPPLQPLPPPREGSSRPHDPQGVAPATVEGVEDGAALDANGTATPGDGQPSRVPWLRQSDLATAGYEVTETLPLGRERTCHSLMVALQLALALGACTYPIFQRSVWGGVPYALRDRGIDFSGTYSMWDLTWIAASPSGVSNARRWLGCSADGRPAWPHWPHSAFQSPSVPPLLRCPMFAPPPYSTPRPR